MKLQTAPTGAVFLFYKPYTFGPDNTLIFYEQKGITLLNQLLPPKTTKYSG